MTRGCPLLVGGARALSALLLAAVLTTLVPDVTLLVYPLLAVVGSVMFYLLVPAQVCMTAQASS